MQKVYDSFIMRPIVDICFKELMRNPAVRAGFAAAIMNCRPEEVEETYLMPTHLQKGKEEEKQGILDVRVLLKQGTQIGIEMQVNYFEYWDERILFYLCKMFTEQLMKGDPYGKLQRCIHVSILDFIHFPEDQECYRKIHFRDGRTGKLFSDKLEIQMLELRKLPEGIAAVSYTHLSVKYRWLLGEKTLTSWISQAPLTMLAVGVSSISLSYRCQILIFMIVLLLQYIYG